MYTDRLQNMTLVTNAARYSHPIGRAIRRIREEQGINREKAAERCGLHRTYSSGVERGVRNVSLVNLEKIAKGLKTGLPGLLERV